MNSGQEKTTDEIIIQTKEYLGLHGIRFFRGIKKKHGRINAIWMEDGIPHPVHFREGMQIRNYLRQITDNSWTDHEYDDNWIEVVERCIV